VQSKQNTRSARWSTKAFLSSVHLTFCFTHHVFGPRLIFYPPLMFCQTVTHTESWLEASQCLTTQGCYEPRGTIRDWFSCSHCSYLAFQVQLKEYWWMDPSVMQSKYKIISKQIHPDKGLGDFFFYTKGIFSSYKSSTSFSASINVHMWLLAECLITSIW